MTTGLVIGKFLPPHRGHEHLVRFASASVDHLTVILFTKAREEIPGDLREAWMRELFPGVELRRVAEEHPVDFADPAAWALWIGAIRRVLPAGPDLVFSSEGYGDELARRLNARHVPVDPERRRVPVSGSLVRADPLGRWEDLPPCVRPHYARRVAVVGAESTGKSTVAAHLAAHLGASLVPEYARPYLSARGGVCLPGDLPEIARAQAAAEQTAARTADRAIVCDTDPLTTALWSERYFGAVDPVVRRLADAARYDLTLLCENDLPWVPDGLRDSPERRGWFRERFARELGQRGRAWRSVAGRGEQRRVAALAAATDLAAELSAARRARPSPTRSGGP